MDSEKVPLNETASEADFFPPETGQCEMCSSQEENEKSQKTASRAHRYRKKPVEVEAVQWFRNGDHPDDDCPVFQRPTGPNGEMMDYPGEDKVVRRFRQPGRDGQLPCETCGHKMDDHGWIDTLEGGHVVCPGDYIITGVQGERYPCKPDIFEKTYEKVSE